MEGGSRLEETTSLFCLSSCSSLPVNPPYFKAQMTGWLAGAGDNVLIEGVSQKEKWEGERSCRLAIGWLARGLIIQGIMDSLLLSTFKVDLLLFRGVYVP